MNCLEFLKHVLPETGLYCYTIISLEKKVRNFKVDTIEELAQKLTSYKSAGDIYYAIGSFDEGNGRKKTDVRLLKEFILDVDVGENKPYKDLNEAGDALEKFLETSGLPVPCMVFSGKGLHLHWVIEKGITRNEWEPHAEQFKRYCKDSGFYADPVRTSDAASILRAPETTNSKYGIRAAHVGGRGNIHLNDFAEKIGYKPEVKPTTSLGSKIVSALKENKELLDPLPIFENCQQMHDFASGVHQNEPTWTATSRVLIHVKDGNKIWHGFSKHDPRYNEDETEKKWKEATEFNNVTTCNFFQNVNSNGCANCSKRVSNPLQFARGIRDERAFELPEGYELNGLSKIVRVKTDKNGETQRIPIYPYPIFVKEKCKSELEANGYAITVSAYNPKEGWRDIQLSMKEFSLTPYAALAHHGVHSNNEEGLKKYLWESYEMAEREKDVSIAYETFGWKEGYKFLWGDRLYYKTDDGVDYDTVHLAGDAALAAPSLRPGGRMRKGTFQGWLEACTAFYAPGHEWQLATVIAAHAAIILPLIASQPCGIIQSLHEMTGGEGKSTATVAGISAFGDFNAAAIGPSDSDAAKFAKVGTFRHLPIAYDEMRRDDPEQVKRFVTDFSIGREKERLTRSGSKAREPRAWCTVLLSNANSELVGAILAAGKSLAMADRVVEMTATKLNLQKRDRRLHLRKAFEDNPGYCAEVFIPVVVGHAEDIVAAGKALSDKYFRELQNDSKTRFKADYMAAFHLAAKILTEHPGMLSFDADRIIKYQLDSIGEAIEEAFPQASMEEILAQYMRDNAQYTFATRAFHIADKTTHDVEYNGNAIKIRINRDTGEIIIPRRELQQYLQAFDVSFKAFTDDLDAKGLLKVRSIKYNLGAGTKVSSAREYCMVIDRHHKLIIGEADRAIDNVTQFQTRARLSTRLKGQ